MWNNPAIAAHKGRVYIAAECLVYRKRKIDPERSRMILISAAPNGSPAQWRWRHEGVLADRALAQALGAERLVSAVIAPGRGGDLLFIATSQSGRGPVGQGCIALALDGLDPPRLRLDPDGKPVVVARQTARGDSRWQTGACAYDAAAETGIITVAATTQRGLRAELLATGLRP